MNFPGPAFRFVIFDLDGTLVEAYGTSPLAHVEDTLHSLTAAGHRLAIATNQAGVAWRVRTNQAKYPRSADLGKRFDEIAARLTPLLQAPWFVAIYDERVRLTPEAYSDLADEMRAANTLLKLHVSAQPDWRKPQPGMLLAACEAWDIAPQEAVYVGDTETDAAAARAAGMPFVSAGRFFTADR